MFLRHSLLCHRFVSSQEEHTRERRERESDREIEGEQSALISMPLMFCSFLSSLNSLLFWNDFTWKFFERKILMCHTYIPYIHMYEYVFWLEVNIIEKSLFSLHINVWIQSVNIWVYFFSAIQIIIQNLICCPRYIWNYWKCKCQKQEREATQVNKTKQKERCKLMKF